MKTTSKCQVTLPAALRRQHGIGPNDEVEFVSTKNGILIRRAKSSHRSIIDRMTQGVIAPGQTDDILKLTRGE